MFECFYPDWYLPSAYAVDYEELYNRGYRGLLFDIDNTLVPHGAPADPAAVALFEKLRAIGFRSCFLSNNRRERVEPFALQVKESFIEKADKPGKKSYRKAMELLGTDVDTTVFIGDQIFTDIFGAKRVGIFTILVQPIHPKEEIQIVLKRKLEKIILKHYRKSFSGV